MIARHNYFTDPHILYLEEPVTKALTQALASGRADLLALAQTLHQQTPAVAVPKTLQGYQIESGQASDYDWMMEGGQDE